MSNRYYVALISRSILATALTVDAYASVDNPVIYSEDLRSASTIQDRDPSYTPTYLVYADRQRTQEEAQKLVQDLGMADHLRQYKARVFVVGPSDGGSYDPVADLTAFQNLLRTRRSSNLKIIGVGSGATFVNNVLAEHAFAVAGILTYGGDVDTGRPSSMPVPAYVHAAKAAVGSCTPTRTALRPSRNPRPTPPTPIRPRQRTAACGGQQPVPWLAVGASDSSRAGGH